jgi:MFS superfamily sulfate permease-like transporter
MSTPTLSSNPYRTILRRRPRATFAWSSATTSPHIDLAGARMLHQLHLNLARCGVQLRIIGARGRVRDLLRAEGIDEKVGGLDRRRTLDELPRSIGS